MKKNLLIFIFGMAASTQMMSWAGNPEIPCADVPRKSGEVVICVYTGHSGVTVQSRAILEDSPNKQYGRKTATSGPDGFARFRVNWAPYDNQKKYQVRAFKAGCDPEQVTDQDAEKYAGWRFIGPDRVPEPTKKNPQSIEGVYMVACPETPDSEMGQLE